MKKEGFTTMEIVVVVLIIALIAATGVVSFSAIGPRRLEAEMRKIVGDLCWAREMAVAKHQNYIVDFDIANDVYIVYQGAINPNNRLKEQELDVDLVSMSPAPNQIQFNFPSGTAQSKQINLNHGGRTGQIVVFGNTGYVRMQ